MNFSLPDLTKDRKDIDWLWNRTLFLTAHGSHAYGTSLPTSDHDYKGFTVPPREYWLGYLKKFEQAEFKGDPDMTVYSIQKFFKLAADCNPSIIEVLFTDPADHIIVTPTGQHVLDHKDLFLSKKAKFTFSGYATSQLKKIETHRKWLLNPPKAAPTRADFGLPERTVIPADQLATAEAMISKLVSQWRLPLEGLDDAQRIGVQDAFAKSLVLVNEAQKAQYLQALQSDHLGYSARTIESVDPVKVEYVAGRQLGFSDNFLELLDKERHYKTKMEEWRSYQNWLATRNAKRSELESKYGYDCYSEETEFLTDKGWLKYDDITADTLLGTLNPSTGTLEFQAFYERVKKPFNGQLVTYNGQKTSFSVTSNHRMWVSPAHRSRGNGFSTKYDSSQSDWQIVRAGEMRVGRNTSLHIRSAVEPSNVEFGIGDDLLIAIGAYVSEGCVGKRTKSGDPTTIRISQMEGGRLVKFMNLFSGVSGVKYRKYAYTRNGRKRREIVWTLNAPVTVGLIADWCKEYSHLKRLPPWISKLSCRQARLLMDVLISGDGTHRKHSDVYYTVSPMLANDIQTLAIVCGYGAAMWGPFQQKSGNKPMYQVFLTKNQFSYIDPSKLSNTEYTGNIVCFSVPNEILITRHNGKTAVQGNTKHGMHMMRLMRMGVEILEQGKVYVRRPDAEELLSIRAGAWSYEKLREEADRLETRMGDLYRTSTLPHTPDHKKLDSLLVDVVATMT